MYSLGRSSPERSRLCLSRLFRSNLNLASVHWKLADKLNFHPRLPTLDSHHSWTLFLDPTNPEPHPPIPWTHHLLTPTLIPTLTLLPLHPYYPWKSFVRSFGHYPWAGLPSLTRFHSKDNKQLAEILEEIPIGLFNQSHRSQEKYKIHFHPKSIICPGPVLKPTELSVVREPFQVVVTHWSNFFHRHITTGPVRIDYHWAFMYSPHGETESTNISLKNLKRIHHISKGGIPDSCCNWTVMVPCPLPATDRLGRGPPLLSSSAQVGGALLQRDQTERTKQWTGQEGGSTLLAGQWQTGVWLVIPIHVNGSLPCHILNDNLRTICLPVYTCYTTWCQASRDPLLLFWWIAHHLPHWCSKKAWGPSIPKAKTVKGVFILNHLLHRMSEM